MCFSFLLQKKLKSLVIGKLYLSVKAYDIAVRHFQAFLSVNENSPETYKLIGKCFQQLGKPEKAIASYKRSLELEPPQPALVLLSKYGFLKRINFISHLFSDWLINHRIASPRICKKAESCCDELRYITRCIRKSLFVLTFWSSHSFWLRLIEEAFST